MKPNLSHLTQNITPGKVINAFFSTLQKLFIIALILVPIVVAFAYIQPHLGIKYTDADGQAIINWAQYKSAIFAVLVGAIALGLLQVLPQKDNNYDTLRNCFVVIGILCANILLLQPTFFHSIGIHIAAPWWETNVQKDELVRDIAAVVLAGMALILGMVRRRSGLEFGVMLAVVAVIITGDFSQLWTMGNITVGFAAIGALIVFVGGYAIQFIVFAWKHFTVFRKKAYHFLFNESWGDLAERKYEQRKAAKTAS